MNIPYISRSLEIPDNVQIEIKGQTLIVKGPLGQVSHSFETTPLSFSLEGKKIGHRIKQHKEEGSKPSWHSRGPCEKHDSGCYEGL